MGRATSSVVIRLHCCCKGGGVLVGEGQARSNRPDCRSGCLGLWGIGRLMFCSQAVEVAKRSHRNAESRKWELGMKFFFVEEDSSFVAGIVEFLRFAQDDKIFF